MPANRMLTLFGQARVATDVTGDWVAVPGNASGAAFAAVSISNFTGSTSLTPKFEHGVHDPNSGVYASYPLMSAAAQTANNFFILPLTTATTPELLPYVRFTCTSNGASVAASVLATMYFDAED